MNVRPILAALKKHKIATLLIVLEIALAFAIVSNAVYVITGRMARMTLPTGVDTRGLMIIKPLSQGNSDNADGTVQANVSALRDIPGVLAASAINSVPISGSQWGLAYSPKPQADPTDGIGTPVYFGGADVLHTLGVKLLQGRDFAQSDYQKLTPKDAFTVFLQQHLALVTQAYAQRLWPGRDPVGRIMYSGQVPVRVVGVVSNLLRPYISSDAQDPSNDFGVFLPLIPSSGLNPLYIIRTRPADRDRVLRSAVAKLEEMHPTGTISMQQTFSRMREEYFRNDKAMAWLLLGSVIALLAMTAIGIVGLASFWVQQRTRQIGVRRALGARRVDVLRYFQVENFLLAGAGIAIGCVAAIGINVWLMAHYQVPRMPFWYLPIGAVTLWLLGQVAVLGPALRASLVSPASAVRLG